MSSGSSGRYQSKLFNFVHQQSRRLTQQWEHTFRHVQVATKWGVEVLLYPVSLLLQSDQSTTKKLQIKEPQSRLQLEPETPPTADTPIQQVLAAIKNLPSAADPDRKKSKVSTPQLLVGENKKPVQYSQEALLSPGVNPKSDDTSPTASPRFHPLAFLGSLWQKFSHHRPTIDSSLPQSLTISDESLGSLHPGQTENSLQMNHLAVQGIATTLVNRHLVLVSTDNVILDILTTQQQAQLETRIINEIANYWRAWRLFEAQKETALIPEIDRLLAKLSGSNPDQITALPPGAIAQAEFESKYLLQSEKILAFLDAVVANLESNALVPVQQRSQEIIQVVQTQFSIFLYGKEQLIARGQISVTADGLETHPLNIPELIAKALNYFFGINSDKNLESRDPDNKTPRKRLEHRNLSALPRSSQLQNENLDPWLSWNDLFGDSKPPQQKPVIPIKKKNTALVSSPLAARPLTKNVTGSYQSLLQPPQPGSGLVKAQKPSSDLTIKQKISQKVTVVKETTSPISQSKSQSHNQNHQGEISQQQPQKAEMEAQPDWIEVKAKHIGYEKHLLEQLLELLDSAMLWLEEIFVKIFQSLQRLWRGK